ncbi:SPO22-domain-containing protein [Polyplosphaeria fusca]|uniref:Protein ZIP4 homolog n=1 Tax=Polyplosphaeria fusca TaxID=682080 RepID=A0A9P4R8D2_9PLEO|nr:SPO22-domain-containing protein [Polyplosphaeria fusca]
MAPANMTGRTEREKKLKALLTFASSVARRTESSPHDATLIDDLQTHIKGLPLPFSPTVAAKYDDLDRRGTELWNLSTRLRREDQPPTDKNKDGTARLTRVLTLLRVFAFLLLDTAANQAKKSRQRMSAVRVMKIALKAARVCVENNELGYATKVLERAAEYDDTLAAQETREEEEEEAIMEAHLRTEYFAMRMTLAWRQNRVDTAEHMFAKCKHLNNCALDPSAAEKLADLLYEIGKSLLEKRNHENAVLWLQRAYDVIGEHEPSILSSDASELRLGIMHGIVQAYMHSEDINAFEKASDMVRLMENDYGDKFVVSLLKLELLSTSASFDSSKYYAVLLTIIRTVVLNETNFKTIMHHVHRLKDHSGVTACKVVEDLLDIRLFREDNDCWIEKAFIARVWIGTTITLADNGFESLREICDLTQRNTRAPLSAPAAHAAQTLLWKMVEAAHNQENFAEAEAWCSLCLHPLFDNAGTLNKSKIARRSIMCALSRQDYPAAREIFSRMSDTGKSEPVTRYLMYKTALQCDDDEFSAECLDAICRTSSKDATLLYACVMEAQSAGNRRQAIDALKKVLERYDYSAPAGVHLPALLRCTVRLLVTQLVKDRELSDNTVEELCRMFDGACSQAKASRRRPSTPAQQQFTSAEFEWFSKNAYNISLKYCTELQPQHLNKLVECCIEFIKLLEEQVQPDDHTDLFLRAMFCHFLAACSSITLARAEDNIESCLQHYLHVREHSREFRRKTADCLQRNSLGNSARGDIISKHLQVVKLEIESVLKLEKWDELDDLFKECWKYKEPDRYETLADLVLVVQAHVAKAGVDERYQRNILGVIQKIINQAWRSSNKDMAKLSRWLRCLFQLALTIDEDISLKCLEHASQFAAARHGVSDTISAHEHVPDTPPPTSPLKSADMEGKDSNHYPPTELEWLASTSFNQAVEYYLQENEEKCNTWADHALNVAQWADDGGRLRNALLERRKALVWSG